MIDSPEPSKAAFESAQTLVEHLFGQKFRRVAFVPRGVMNHKFKVTLADGDAYAIRVYPPNREQVVGYEPDLLRRCEAAGLSIPKVMIDSRSGPAVGHCYTVYHWIEGYPLDERLPFIDETRLGIIMQELMRFLARFARLEVTGYGELVSATHARFSTWRDFLETVLTESLHPRRKNPWGSETFKKLKALIKGAAAAAPECEPVLTWGDISPENIILDAEDHIAGIVDFEGVLAADFALTLGYCYARYFNTPFFEALMKVWPKNQRRNIDCDFQFFSVLRALRLGQFASIPMPTGYPRQPVEQVLPGFRQTLGQMHQY